MNLKTVICIEGVDFKRAYSNSCVEVFNVLDIEAAREAIFKELQSVIEYDGSRVNYRHLALLCDVMTIVDCSWRLLSLASIAQTLEL
jgi:DNA-directed RNA polymerase II subunit RPB1